MQIKIRIPLGASAGIGALVLVCSFFSRNTFAENHLSLVGTELYVGPSIGMIRHHDFKKNAPLLLSYSADLGIPFRILNWFEIGPAASFAFVRHINGLDPDIGNHMGKRYEIYPYLAKNFGESWRIFQGFLFWGEYKLEKTTSGGARVVIKTPIGFRTILSRPLGKLFDLFPVGVGLRFDYSIYHLAYVDEAKTELNRKYRVWSIGPQLRIEFF